ncbi:hypothetical protein [Rhizobium sp. NFR03]|nr:hypothetical protein [Rhizobium sp. NFR03]SES26531.1 hypothetical protein SAMN03159406_03089 [Rhizobium sp. NFR03]
MTNIDKPYEPVSFAKKHRISVEDATAILKEAAGNKKLADKEGRRVAV